MLFQSVVAIGHWLLAVQSSPSPRVPRKSPQAMVRPVPAANWSCLRVVAPMALFRGGFVHHTQAHKLRPAVRCGKSRIGMASGAGIANLDFAGVVFVMVLGGIWSFGRASLLPTA
jgi:hypothetical protein